MKEKTPKQNKTKNQNNTTKVILISTFVILVLVSSIFLNKQIRVLFTHATNYIDYAPTLKQKNLLTNNTTLEKVSSDNNTNQLSTDDPTPTQTNSLNKENSSSQDLQNETVEPKPVPTSGLDICRIGAPMDSSSCDCPDWQGLECAGERTNQEINFYLLNEYARIGDRTDTEGWYFPLKNRWVYKQLPTDYEKKQQQSNCQEWCIGKPVIYLYPLAPAYIDVEVVAPGTIFVSDPWYPQGGWKNVLAYPNGSLIYQGQAYRELYYETDIDGEIRIPNNGLLIERENLLEKLTLYTMQLGLSEFESSEFTEYWVPLLRELDAPYILFSILDKEEKERIDTVRISPTPDTFIAFIAYFKPVYSYYQPPPLELPPHPPKRIGFTAVEWGGTVDTQHIQ